MNDTLGVAGPRLGGEDFVEQQLSELRRRVAGGETCFAVFDLDNTLFDSRWRTLHAARRFDAESGTRHFEALGIDGVRLDGARTYRQMGGSDPAVEQSFQRFWAAEFWDPGSFAHDRPLGPMVERVLRARREGASVRFLTGRVREYEAVSLGQLHGAGLGFVTPSHLRHKPSRDLWTVQYKHDELCELSKAGWIAWYVTESRAEIAGMQRMSPALPLLLLDCSLERGGPAVTPGTPVLPACF